MRLIFVPKIEKFVEESTFSVSGRGEGITMIKVSNYAIIHIFHTCFGNYLPCLVYCTISESEPRGRIVETNTSGLSFECSAILRWLWHKNKRVCIQFCCKL